jgi:hypothetical protein
MFYSIFMYIIFVAVLYNIYRNHVILYDAYL